MLFSVLMVGLEYAIEKLWSNGRNGKGSTQWKYTCIINVYY